MDANEQAPVFSVRMALMKEKTLLINPSISMVLVYTHTDTHTGVLQLRSAKLPLVQDSPVAITPTFTFQHIANADSPLTKLFALGVDAVRTCSILVSIEAVEPEYQATIITGNVYDVEHMRCNHAFVPFLVMFFSIVRILILSQQVCFFRIV